MLYLSDHHGSRVADLAAEFAIGIGVGVTGKSIDRLEKQGWAARHRTQPTAAPRSRP